MMNDINSMFKLIKAQFNQFDLDLNIKKINLIDFNWIFKFIGSLV